MDAMCQSCGTVWGSGVKPIWECDNLAQRIEPGEPLPVGECPKCGAFCHYIDPRCGLCDRDIVCHLRHKIRELVLDAQWYFGEDKILINTLIGISHALAENCKFYEERIPNELEG